MKKTILVLLSVVMVAAMVLTLTACSPCARNGHTWGEWEQSDIEGKLQRECSVCHQKEYKNITAPEGHECADVCPECGKCLTECEEPECAQKCPGHQSPEEPCEHEVLTPHAKKDATCLDGGWDAYWECEECGQLFSDSEGDQEIDEIPTTKALGHDDSSEDWQNDAEHKQHYVVCARENCNEHLKVEACAEYLELVETDETYHTPKCSKCHHEYEADKAEHTYDQHDGTECACGKLKPGHEHSMKPVVEYKEATCTQDGNVKYYECETCGHFYEDAEGEREITNGVTIPAHHTYTELKLATKGADCQTYGTVAHYECEKCDKWFANDEAKTDLPEGESRKGELGDHIYGEWQQAQPGKDCQTQGTIAHYQCSKCEQYFDQAHEQIDSIAGGPVGSHIFDQQKPAIPATCGTAGEIAHNHCQVCDKWYNLEGEEIQTWVDPATGLHTFTGDWTSKDAETHHRKCANCDEYEEKAHTWGTTAVEFDTAWHKVKCTAEGCNETKTVEHEWQYSNPTLEQHTKYCKVEGCDQTVIEDHDFGEGAYGSETRHNCECGEKVCGETTVDKTAEYTYTDTVNVPLDGVTVNVLDLLTLQFIKDKSTYAPQYNKAGYIQFYGGNQLTITCLVKVTKIEFTLDSKKGDIAVVSGGGSYSLSGSVGTWTADDTTGSTIVLRNGTSSTAQAQIKQIKIYYAETVATGTHNYEVTQSVPATCTEAGSTTSTCKRCGKVEVTTINPTGHAEELTHHQLEDSTCTQTGTVEYWFCNQCNKYFTTEACEVEIPEGELTIAKKNHVNEGEWFKGEGEHVGQHYQECKTCGQEEGRNYVACNTEAWGSDEEHHWKVCSVCGYNYGEQQDRAVHHYDEKTDQCVCGKNNPVHVHEWDEPVPEQAATCTDPGNPAYVHCRACGNYYTNKEDEQQLSEEELVIEALGHNIANARYEKVSDEFHAKKCERCLQYVEQTEHEMPSIPTNVDHKQHKLVCTECGYEKFEAHTFGTEAKRTDCACGEEWCYVENGDDYVLDTSNSSGLGLSSSYSSNTGKTVGGITFSYNNLATTSNKIQMNNGKTPNCSLWNTTPFAGNIVGLVITMDTKSGDVLKVELSKDGSTWITHETIKGDTGEYSTSIDASNGYKYIRLSYAASKGALYITSITVKYSTTTESHVWEETGRVAGSCAEGTMDSVSYKCVRCPATKTEEEPAKHNIGWIEEKTETCTEGGYIAHYECSVCHKWFDGDGADASEVDKEVKDALEHDYDYRDNGTQHQLHCTRNDYEGDWQEHTATEWVVETESHYQTCEACQATFNQGGHQYTDEDKCVCGKEDPDKHVHNWATGDDWSYDVDGHWHRCLNGCEEKQDLVSHNWDEIENYEHDQEGKYHWKYCDECLFENEDAKEAHGDFSDYNSNDDQYHNARCGICGANVALEHSLKYDDWGDSDEHYVSCEDDCGYEEFEAHIFTSYTNNGASGHDAYCETCGATVEQEHSYNSGECVCGEQEPVKTKYFVKVMNATTVQGGTYLIVYEAGNVILDASSTTKETRFTVTISDSKIEATDEILMKAFKISGSGTTWYIESTSLSSTYYLGQNSDANGSVWSTTKNSNKQISVSNGDATIISSGGAYLRYNASNNPPLFRYYKSSSYSSQKAVQLYLLQD